MMKFRKTLMVAVSAALLGAAAVPMTASADVGVYFNVAPPPLRYEAVPAPRNGYVWAPGYWNASGSKHVWKAGHWEAQRPGHYWSQSTWTQHDNRWQLDRGHWNKGDRDGDGVPNSVDRAPDNPVRH
jgi:WXXGXW repeat (2 copies)